jgi:Protein of unknwon function (DUF3310)
MRQDERALGRRTICSVCGRCADHCQCPFAGVHVPGNYGDCVECETPEDPVNPAHYQGDYVMRVIEDFHLDFLKGTVVKYLLRAGSKNQSPELQDLKKARWYLDRKIASMEKPAAADIPS